ncbi:hypothetical protein Tco_1393683 [Tanacetum coccineum]
MRTRSQSREQRPPPPEGTPVVIEPLRIEYPFQEDPTVEPMADTRTMAQLLQAPTEGYEDAILIPEIVANNFELKHGLINLVQNKQFFGHDKEDPHAHIRYFNKITSTMRVPNVPITTIKLMLFPFSIEGAARIFQGSVKHELIGNCCQGKLRTLPTQDVSSVLLLKLKDIVPGSNALDKKNQASVSSPALVRDYSMMVTKDQVHPSCSQSTAPVQPPVGPEPITTPVLEPIVAPVVAPVPNTKPSVSLPHTLRG